jgi:hypothetical protein
MLLMLLLVNMCVTINTTTTITVSIIFMKCVSMFMNQRLFSKSKSKVEQFEFPRVKQIKPVNIQKSENTNQKEWISG